MLLGWQCLWLLNSPYLYYKYKQIFKDLVFLVPGKMSVKNGYVYLLHKKRDLTCNGTQGPRVCWGVRWWSGLHVTYGPKLILANIDNHSDNIPIRPSPITTQSPKNCIHSDTAYLKKISYKNFLYYREAGESYPPFSEKHKNW